MALARILNQVADGVGILQDRVFKFANPALAEITGYTVGEMTGIPFAKLTAPQYLAAQNRRYELRIAGVPAPSSYKVDLVRKGGEVITVEASSGGIIRWSGGPAIVAIVRPVEKN
jgi:PAS domain S-box-containing protein